MKIIVLLITIFSSLYVFADMQGQILFKDKSLNKGQTIDVLLMVERSNMSFILQDEDLILKKVSPALVIIKPNWIKVSENNADIIEASVLISVIGEIKSWDSITLPLLQEKINFQLKTIPKIEGFQSEPFKEFQFLPFSIQTPISPFVKKIILFGIILIVVLGLIWLFSFIKRKKTQKKILQERRRNYDFWKSKFEKAKGRKDFEILLQDQESWRHYIIDPSITKSFIDKVSEVQYSPDWSDEVIKEIQLHQQRILKVFTESTHGI